MGYYIECENNLNKASQIVSRYNAKPWHAEVLKGEDVCVCVVNNGYFDAAAICADTFEVESFNDPSDDRSKTWLRVNRRAILQDFPEYEELLIGKSSESVKGRR